MDLQPPVKVSTNSLCAHIVSFRSNFSVLSILSNVQAPAMDDSHAHLKVLLPIVTTICVVALIVVHVETCACFHITN